MMGCQTTNDISSQQLTVQETSPPSSLPDWGDSQPSGDRRLPFALGSGHEPGPPGCIANIGGAAPCRAWFQRGLDCVAPALDRHTDSTANGDLASDCTGMRRFPPLVIDIDTR